MGLPKAQTNDKHAYSHEELEKNGKFNDINFSNYILTRLFHQSKTITKIFLYILLPAMANSAQTLWPSGPVLHCKHYRRAQLPCSFFESWIQQSPHARACYMVYSILEGKNDMPVSIIDSPLILFAPDSMVKQTVLPKENSYIPPNLFYEVDERVDSLSLFRISAGCLSDHIGFLTDGRFLCQLAFRQTSNTPTGNPCRQDEETRSK